MRKLQVYVELSGKQVHVGNIHGNGPDDACFEYDKKYIETQGAMPISLSLPFLNQEYDSEKTKYFFEGLLPEGFTRRCVAEWMHVEENDYLSILAGLGHECLGAIKILEEGKEAISPAYKQLSFDDVRNLAKEGATESAQMVTKAHLSLTGASGKAGLYYDERNSQWYLPIGDAPSTHIVKQSHVRLEGIVTNEQLCLLTAQYLGIDTPESFVIDTGNSQDGDILFATKRYDLIYSARPYRIDGLPVPYRIHQEDFAQAMGISAQRKYEHNQEGYLKKMFDLLRVYSANPIIDQLKLRDICVFNYLVGNTDGHIKNFSLLYGKDLKTVRLAPAYDIVSTAVYENCTKEMAFSIGGNYALDKIDYRSFEREAKESGIGVKVAMKRFNFLASNFTNALQRSSEYLVEQGFVNAGEIKERILKNGGIQFCKAV